jgi:hypothetical protein
LVTPVPLSPLLLLCCAYGGGSIKISLQAMPYNVIVLQSPHIRLVLLDTGLQIQPAMLQLRLLQQGLIALLVRTLPPPPVTNQNKI